MSGSNAYPSVPGADPNAAYLGGGNPANPSLAPAAPAPVAAPAAPATDSDPTGLQALAGDVANTAEQTAPTLAQMAEDGVDIIAHIAAGGLVAGSIASIADVVAFAKAASNAIATVRQDVEGFGPAMSKVKAFFSHLL